jgi:hypothetical protein
MENVRNTNLFYFVDVILRINPYINPYLKKKKKKIKNGRIKVLYIPLLQEEDTFL